MSALDEIQNRKLKWTALEQVILSENNWSLQNAAADEYMAMETTIAAQAEAIEAARALNKKMLEVYDSPDYKAVWTLWSLHGGRYNGGDWISEQEELAAALSKLDGAK